MSNPCWPSYLTVYYRNYSVNASRDEIKPERMATSLSHQRNVLYEGLHGRNAIKTLYRKCTIDLDKQNKIMDIHSYLLGYGNTHYGAENQIKRTDITLLRHEWKLFVGVNCCRDTCNKLCKRLMSLEMNIR